MCDHTELFGRDRFDPWEDPKAKRSDNSSQLATSADDSQVKVNRSDLDSRMPSCRIVHIGSPLCTMYLAIRNHVR
jgi:hypothetical protein